MAIGVPRPLAIEKPQSVDLAQAARYFGAHGEPDAATLALLQKCAVPLLAAAMLCADSVSSIEDVVFERRFACADGFAAFGADVQVQQRTLHIRPVRQLQGAEAAARIKALLRESNYEISVGVHQIEPDENLEDGVDRAENAMRRDKEAYYRETGNLDQMRVLNEKLERILVEKRDMDMFLRAIAPRYIGVYAVDNDTGRMRSIVIPDRFRRIVKEAKGLFIPALAQYAEEVVADAWRGSFDPLLDLPGVIRRIEREGMVCATFRRRDGAWIRLQVMRYLPDEDEGGGTLRIFSAADADEQRA